MLQSTNHSAGGIPVVLGGGAMRGVSLLGFLDYLEDEGVICSDYTGVSIGSIVAAFYTNGYTTRQICDVFLNELANPSLTDLVSALMPPLFNPLRLLAGGFIDMVPFVHRLVEKYGLTTQDNLRIVAYDLRSRKPIVFEGHDYDLVVAIAASCAVPGVMRPVLYKKDGSSYMLVDGGVYHPQPGKFCKVPAIIAKLIDMPGMEMLFPDRRCDFVASVGDPSSPFFGRLSVQDVESLHQFGYSRARDDLRIPIKRGEIPVAA